MSEFVHLHVHSDFSLTDASVTVMSLADRAEELGMTHLALTDHGNMFGAMEFIAACEHEKRKNPIKPIIGCEVYVSPGSRFEKKGSENDNKYYHMVLLAANREGYFNLVKLCTCAYLEGFYYRPRIDEDLLTRFHGGLIALSACASGEIQRLILNGKEDEAEKKAVYYRDLFGKDENGEPNYYLELQDHGIPAGGLRGADLSQQDINRILAGISKRTGIPLVATNDVHYLEKDDYVAHDILLCIGTAKNRNEEKRKKYYGDQFYFKTQDEMSKIFSEYPQAVENTVKIAQRCNTDVPKVSVKELPKYLPDFDIPKEYESPQVYLRELAFEGLKYRYPKEMEENGQTWEEIRKRADYELDTIINMGFTGYFLIVWDFIDYANKNGISVGPGRGSGAGSIVAYALRITNIDPLKYKLIFERFLNPERISMPDFDIDFENERRDEVIKYVTEKYGENRVCQIITFGTLGAKAVIKDVCRTLGISIPESEMITKLIGKELTLKKAFENEPKLSELERDPRFTEMFAIARKLEGLNRHSSIHAAGVVIGKTELVNFVPLYQEREDSKSGKTGTIATQYSMNYLESRGLVKMDFLGLKTLDVIKRAEKLIRLRGGKYSGFDIEKIPEDDKKTFKMLVDGKSFGVFQFESDGMQNILKQTKPGSIEDLIALNAMYRPGPMQDIPRFIESKNGRQEITYPDPSLEKVLKETYGVIIYQEQVMEVAQIIAGFTAGHADELRRAMGKKIMEKMVKEKEKFITGAKERGYSERKADEIFELLIPFAGYGFNKSHAAAYSVLAYQTAYLKANFTVEFMAANLTNDINNPDKLPHCINEARKMGIEVTPPDINRSDIYFTVSDGKIIYGFLGVKGLGEASSAEIVRGREDSPYKSFMDFLERVDIKAVGKKNIELLIQTGAFDQFGVTRETLGGNLEQVVEYAIKKKEDRIQGQTSLFEDTGESEYADFEFKEFPQISRADRLGIEKKLIGFYFSGHPLDEYRDLWEKAVKVNLGDKENLKTGNCILIGIITSLKSHITNKGAKMAFATLEDFNGEIDVTFFSASWSRYESMIEVDKIYILRGKIDYLQDRDKFSFTAEEVISKNDVDNAIKESEEMALKTDAHRNTWNYMADLKSGFLSGAKKGSYTIIGYLKKLREWTDKNGNTMAFGTLQDFEGDIELVFFSKPYAECKALLNLDEIIALKGNIDPENDRDADKKAAFKVTSIADFAQLSRSASRKQQAGEKPPVPSVEIEKPAVKLEEIHIQLQKNGAEKDENLLPLRDYLAENSGSSLVFIHIPAGNSERIIKINTGIDISNNGKVLEEIKKCGCVADVWRV